MKVVEDHDRTSLFCDMPEESRIEEHEQHMLIKLKKLCIKIIAHIATKCIKLHSPVDLHRKSLKPIATKWFNAIAGNLQKNKTKQQNINN